MSKIQHHFLRYLAPIRPKIEFMDGLILTQVSGLYKVELLIEDNVNYVSYTIGIFPKNRKENAFLTSNRLGFSYTGPLPVSQKTKMFTRALAKLIEKNIDHLDDAAFEMLFFGRLKPIHSLSERELIAFMSGLKPALRGHLHPKFKEDFIAVFNFWGAHVGFSDFIADYHQGLLKQGHVNKNEAELHFYVSHKEDDIRILKRLEAASDIDSITVGKILGYPTCCVHHFETVTHLPSPDILLRLIRDQKEPARAELNHLTGNVLISHFPCSLSCKPSVEYGKKLLPFFPEAMRELSHGHTIVYFNNGAFFELEIIETSKQEPSRFRLIEKSPGSFGGKYTDSDELKDFEKAIINANAIKIDSDVELFNGSTKLFHLEGRRDLWDVIEFEKE